MRFEITKPRAFTLVELIVVIVILAVLSGVVVLRVLNSGARQADVESQAVQRLLTVAAERDASSSEPQAIEYDDSVRELRLLTQRAAAQAPLDWQPDPILPPVFLSKARLAQAWVDGRPLPRNRWRVGFSASQARPGLVLELESTSGPGGTSRNPTATGAWRVTLGPDDPAASRAAIKSGQGVAVVASSRAVDLDAAGKGAKPW